MESVKEINRLLSEKQARLDKRLTLLGSLMFFGSTVFSCVLQLQ